MGKPSNRATVSLRIVETVAKEQDVDETELDPLGELVDNDALDALIESADSTEIAVQFEYEQQTVHIDTSGEVTVTIL